MPKKKEPILVRVAFYFIFLKSVFLSLEQYFKYINYIYIVSQKKKKKLPMYFNIYYKYFDKNK